MNHQPGKKGGQLLNLSMKKDDISVGEVQASTDLTDLVMQQGLTMRTLRNSERMFVFYLIALFAGIAGNVPSPLIIMVGIKVAIDLLIMMIAAVRLLILFCKARPYRKILRDALAVREDSQEQQRQGRESGLAAFKKAYGRND